MERTLFNANEVLAFFVELVALAALAYWGYEVTGIPLAIAFPLAAAVLWGLFAAPRARFKVALPVVLAVKVLVFGAAVVGLLVTGHPVLGVLLALVALANTAAATVWRARGLTFGA